MIDPTTGEEQPHPLEGILEASILQGETLKEQGSEANAILEAIALQTQENNPEPILGAIIVNDNKNTEKLVGAIKELKPELEKSASSTDRMVNFLEQMKGEDGHTPTEEELLALIEPRIPEPIKGDDGKTPTSEELIELIEPIVEDKMPTDEKLVELITPLIPPPIKPKDGVDGLDADEEAIVKKVLKKVPKAKDGKDGSPDTGEEIVTKLSKLKGDKRLDKSAIKGLDKMQKEIDHIAFGSNGQEYRIAGTKVSSNSSNLNFIAGSNTTITGVPTSDGANITITATGGGGGAVDSVNGQTGVVVLDQDDVLDGTTYKQYSQTEKTKLAGIETGAEVNTIDTVSDTTEIDLTITARDLTASIVSGSIDETKLDTSVNASLDLADTAVQPAGLSGYQLTSQKDSANGYAGLDAGGKINSAQIPDIGLSQFLGNFTDTTTALANAGVQASQIGDWFTVDTSGGQSWIVTTSLPTTLADITQLKTPTDAVTSVFSRTGAVTAQNGDYTASNITNVPAGNIAAVTVQAALDELDTDKEPTIATGGTNTVWHGNKVFSAVVEADITLSDNTTNNVSTVKHGLMSKLPGTTTVFYRGDGAFTTPSATTVPNAYVIQAFTNTSYNLVHNLGSYPVVQVLDATGAVVIPLSIVNNTVNDLTVTFTTTGTYTVIATLGSPQLQSYVSTAVDYSATITDRIIEVTDASKTVTLPTANVTNTGYEYKVDNSSTGAVFLDSQGGETIQGELIQTIPPNSCISVYANGISWRID